MQEIEEYKTACEKLVSIFCKKHDFEFNGWVGDKVGQVAYCSDYTFYLSDIILDLINDADKSEILNWMDLNDNSNNYYINYNSYLMGLRNHTEMLFI